MIIAIKERQKKFNARKSLVAANFIKQGINCIIRPVEFFCLILKTVLNFGKVFRFNSREKNITCGKNYCFVYLLNRPLGDRVKGSERFNRVSKKIEPYRGLVARRKDINNSSPNRKISYCVNERKMFIAQVSQTTDQGFLFNIFTGDD